MCFGAGVAAASEAGLGGLGGASRKPVDAKPNALQRTEAMLNERLASAAASLQNFKMASLDKGGGAAGHPPGFGAQRGGKRASAAARASGGLAALGGASDASLALQGERLPSSSEKLDLILSDLMR